MMLRCPNARTMGLASPVHQTRLHSVCCHASKGFKDGDSKGPALKINERGKVSSRPGPSPPPRKGQQAQRPAGDASSEAEPSLQAEDAAASPASLSSSSPEASSSQPQQPQQRTPLKAVASTPQAVVDRMLPRMIACAGVPVSFGLLSLPIFWYLKMKADVDYPMWIVYAGQAVTFGGGLLGITYGILSTSWDPAREGSFWGITEISANLPQLLNRNKKSDA